MTKRSLKARDIERLENTSVASAMGAATFMGATAGHNAGCLAISCEGAGATCQPPFGTSGSVGACSLIGGVCCTGCTACTACTVCSSCTICTGSTIS